MNKADRKKLIQKFKENEKETFFNSLPMSKELFQELFDFLDVQIGENGCNHSFNQTKIFLQSKNIPIKSVLDWIIEDGQGCDCEVLANLEDDFA